MKFSKVMLILVLILICVGVTDVSASSIMAISANNAVCHNGGVLKAIRIISYVILVIKIMVPVILIIMAIKDLAKAVIEGDEGDIAKFVPLFIGRFVTGVAIFFIPTLVNTMMSAASGYDKTEAKFTDCGKCLTSVKSCDSLINAYAKK